MGVSRRRWLGAAGTGTLGAALAPRAEAQAATTKPVPPAIAALAPMTDGVAPIGAEERRARVERARGLMAKHELDAIVIAAGSTLDYFTGARWGNSERFFGVVIPRRGEAAWVTPAFEKDRALEQVPAGSEVRAWEEHESPYALLAGIVHDRGGASGRIGVEETMPFVFADGLAQALPAARVVSATPVTAGCRMIKDAHELALMERAALITVTAHRAVFASLREGLTQAEVGQMSAEAHRRLGMRGGSLVLFGADAAFPHGTTKPQPLRRGDVVLIDGGGRLHGYASDITRTGVFGAPPTDRQRRVWDVVRKAQQAAFEAARPGVACQEVDRAARKVIEDAGFGPGYRYFTHRLGHGMGLDGHEWTYLVEGNQTPLQPGMCFSDEPGIYIPGELGVRHEDMIAITDSGARNLGPKWSGTPEEPAVV
ncbi:MAG: Xaa-Pro peptidase family protein [Vicinamibacteria bacterium]|nr:Xaa-Pro peptidase family protein [Vicinamibacteria bacterium]